MCGYGESMIKRHKKNIKKIPFFLIIILTITSFFTIPISSAYAQNMLPELEIDDNENSEKILENTFEMISTRWADGFLLNLDKRQKKKLKILKEEFDSKIQRAQKRIFELRHLIDSQPRTAPYFASFYFSQIIDLKYSVDKLAISLKEKKKKIEHKKRELENSLLMIKTLKIKEPELKWQKNWIKINLNPIIKAENIWIIRINKMLGETKELQDELNYVFKDEEKKTQANYRKFYSHRFKFFGNIQNSFYLYRLKVIVGNFFEWRLKAICLAHVILPNSSLMKTLLTIFAISSSLFLCLGFFLYKKFKNYFSPFITPYILCFLGIYFMLCMLTLPSTNDIVIFTLAGNFTAIGILDIAWRLRKKSTSTKALNPFVAMILAFTLIDIMVSMLVPVDILLTIILLISIFELLWLLFIFSKYKYQLTEKILAGLLPVFIWSSSGLAAWLGYLYPSMLISVTLGLSLCIFYCGSVFTQALLDFSGKMSQRHLITSFVFTLMIPLLWLGMLIGSLRWIGQIFNAKRLLQVIYTADMFPNLTLNISPQIILLLLLLGLLIKFILTWASHMVQVFTGARKLDAGSINSAFLIFQYIVWSIFIIHCLNSLHIDWNRIKYVIGGLSVGFGFALKELLENFVCGLILLMGKEVRPGDIVEFDGTMGLVEKINIRATFIKTYEHAIITLPNSQVVSKDFKNWTLNSHVMRRQLDVTVAYGSDVEQVVELMLEAANQSKFVLQIKKPEVLFIDFGESALVFRLRFWINIDNIVTAPSDIRKKIDKLFKENNIVIAFPQLDIHMNTLQNT